MTQTVQICIRMISPEDVVTDNCRSEFVHVSLWRSLGALPSGGKVSAPETAGLQVLPRGGDLSAIQNRAAELKVLGKNDRYVVDSAITLSLARYWKLFHLNCVLCTDGILKKANGAGRHDSRRKFHRLKGKFKLKTNLKDVRIRHSLPVQTAGE